MDDLGDRMVDALLRDFPDHVEGTRPVHSRGIGVEGHFQPSDVAADYCTAEHFVRDRIDATVRFSNGSGSQSARDFDPGLRGMAVKFHLPDGGETDLIAITVPVIPFRTPEEFFSFAAAAVPVPVRRPSIVERLLGTLALRQAPPDPPEPVSALPGLFFFGVAQPAAGPGLLAMKTAVVPASYARAAYHAVHAFRVTGAEGVVRSVRFHWDPAAGVRPLTGDDSVLAEDFLQTELARRVAEGPVEFSLRMQVADVGDDTSDPTRAWPGQRRLVDMGRMTLSALADPGTTERLSFNPTRLVDGIACSDDEILRTRGLAYQASWERRALGRCPVI